MLYGFFWGGYEHLKVLLHNKGTDDTHTRMKCVRYAGLDISGSSFLPKVLKHRFDVLELNRAFLRVTCK